MSEPSRELLLRRDKVKDARIAELEALSNTSICIFCGTTMDKDLNVMLDHAKGCEKRPENNLFKRAEQAEAAMEKTVDALQDAVVMWSGAATALGVAEAALAERDRMLRLAILDGEHPAGMDVDYLADLRARAEEGTAP